MPVAIGATGTAGTGSLEGQGTDPCPILLAECDGQCFPWQSQGESAEHSPSFETLAPLYRA